MSRGVSFVLHLSGVEIAVSRGGGINVTGKLAHSGCPVFEPPACRGAWIEDGCHLLHDHVLARTMVYLTCGQNVLYGRATIYGIPVYHDREIYIKRQVDRDMGLLSIERLAPYRIDVFVVHRFPGQKLTSAANGLVCVRTRWLWLELGGRVY